MSKAINNPRSCSILRKVLEEVLKVCDLLGGGVCAQPQPAGGVGVRGGRAGLPQCLHAGPQLWSPCPLIYNVDLGHT